jgi:hypothetical protein
MRPGQQGFGLPGREPRGESQQFLACRRLALGLLVMIRAQLAS